MSESSPIFAVVLAAGKGTRMKSNRAKVLHTLCGIPMVNYVIEATRPLLPEQTFVVVGHQADLVEAVLPADATALLQEEQLGTGDAVRVALSAIPEDQEGVLLVVNGDGPLISDRTLGELVERHRSAGVGATVLVAEPDDPSGLGRVVEDAGVVRIVEEKDATEAERAVSLCNGGLMAIRGDLALALLDRIENRNAQGEFYLTDIVAIARQLGHRTAFLVVSEQEVHGINDRAQLAAAERMMQDRLRQAAMMSGVTLVAPETVFLSHDTRLGRDVVVEPHVVFGPGVAVEEGAVVHSFSHLEGARIASGASVGPFARLRPGASIGPGAKVGNFVEIKNTELGAGAKVSHLTYLGDASVGAEANIGAGTVTCNYDGFNKYRTQIGEGAFIGSNSSLVAPISIGRGAYVGSGSVITENVPEDGLGLGRSRQAVKEGWAVTFRQKAKAAKGK